MINPDSKKIEQVFSWSHKLVVPKYQRNYQWGINQVDELISDLEDSIESERSLFLWNFIFDDSEDGTSTIVDWQQRITTISIFLIAIKYAANNLNKFKFSNAVQAFLTYVDRNWEESWVKLTPSPSIESIYNYIVHPDRDWEFPHSIDWKWIKRQVNKVRPVFKAIFSVIKDLNLNSLKRYYSALLDSYVIVLSFKENDDVFDIFERTNARWLDLNIDDLLKNHIFSKSSDVISEDDLLNKWDHVVDNAWSTLPKMLKYFRVSRNWYIKRSDLYRNLKSYSLSKWVETLLRDLSEFSEYYSLTFESDSDKMSKWLLKFWADKSLYWNESYVDDIVYSLQALSLFKVRQPIPIIFSALKSYVRLKSNLKSVIKLIKAIEYYHFINNIVVVRVWNEVEKMYAKRAEILFNTANLEQDIDKFIQELRNKKAEKKEFVALFTDIWYNDWVWIIMYIFDKINNYEKKWGQKVRLFDKDGTFDRKNYNIEHILAQKNKDDNDDWTNIIDNIWNLIVLSRHDNSKLWSKSVKEKFDLMKDPNNTWWLWHVSDLVKEYWDFADRRDEQIINERANKIAEMAYDKIWRI